MTNSLPATGVPSVPFCDPATQSPSATNEAALRVDEAGRPVLNVEVYWVDEWLAIASPILLPTFGSLVVVGVTFYFAGPTAAILTAVACIVVIAVSAVLYLNGDNVKPISQNSNGGASEANREIEVLPVIPADPPINPFLGNLQTLVNQISSTDNMDYTDTILLLGHYGELWKSRFMKALDDPRNRLAYHSKLIELIEAAFVAKSHPSTLRGTLISSAYGQLEGLENRQGKTVETFSLINHKFQLMEKIIQENDQDLLNSVEIDHLCDHIDEIPLEKLEPLLQTMAALYSTESNCRLLSCILTLEAHVVNKRRKEQATNSFIIELGLDPEIDIVPHREEYLKGQVRFADYLKKLGEATLEKPSPPSRTLSYDFRTGTWKEEYKPGS